MTVVSVEFNSQSEISTQDNVRSLDKHLNGSVCASEWSRRQVAIDRELTFIEEPVLIAVDIDFKRVNKRDGLAASSCVFLTNVERN